MVGDVILDPYPEEGDPMLRECPPVWHDYPCGHTPPDDPCGDAYVAQHARDAAQARPGWSALHHAITQAPPDAAPTREEDRA